MRAELEYEKIRALIGTTSLVLWKVIKSRNKVFKSFRVTTPVLTPELKYNETTLSLALSNSTFITYSWHIALKSKAKTL
jgi:hypothetical protein